MEIDLNSLRHNAEVLSARLPDGCTLMPAVKADAYGHGAVPVARALQQSGVQAFCTATAEEGVQLRQAGISGEILVLGYTHPVQFPLLSRYDLTQTVLDREYAAALESWGRMVKVQIAVDTGMHRIGIPWNDVEALGTILSVANLHVTGLYTHLCADDTTDAADRAFTTLQAERFAQVTTWAKARGYQLKAHLLGSYGLLNYPQLGGAYARVGIALYGVLSTGEDLARCPVELHPVLSWKARVASIRRVRRGEPVGYGLAERAQRDTVVATLAVGYADGLPRALSCGRGAVLLHGRRAPILGRICMDQTMVDVGAIPGVRPGDAAMLLGQDGEEQIAAWELAESSGTITNELLSRLGPRVKRCYQ